MPTPEMKKPNFRKLRAYAFDPSLSIQIDTAKINKIIYKIPWEELQPGPIGDYLEVIDYDPSVGKFYRPIDLNDTLVLAEDGLDPSESNPQFHQQMVYAVAMTTIKNFETALGRKVLWSTRLLDPSMGDFEAYVARLRIYPHALREANAYFSPHKKALLFGYFSSTPADRVMHMPNSLVMTCLSHDIIAHEVTHAILDGMHRYYNQPTNPDVLAFHEAFADIIALFQHFTFPEVLKHQIAKTRGDLATENLLGQLAQEFGSAIGGYGSLRDALGGKTEDEVWEPKVADPEEYQQIMEPHARGSILVSAVFEAFVIIYKKRISDLLRIATSGTGILPPGELPPDLVNRLAKEASKAAKHVLNMCIRALDYSPPVDITFGDFLRAIITADIDLVKDDNRDYRLAFVDAFRRRGIYPEDIKTLSIESLQYKPLDLHVEKAPAGGLLNVKMQTYNWQVDESIGQLLMIINEFLRDYGNRIKYVNDREQIYNLTKDYISGSSSDGEHIMGLHERLNIKFSDSLDFSKITGLAFFGNPEQIGVRTSKRYDGPSFQIQNLRLVSRVGPEGNTINQVVFSLIQRSGVIVEDGEFKGHYIPSQDPTPEMGFELLGGCTLIFDLDTLKLRYAIFKPLLDREKLEERNGNFYVTPEIDKKRVLSQYKYLYDDGLLHISEYGQYFGNGLDYFHYEPFSLLHKH